MKKCLAVVIILLFVGTAIVPSSGQIEKISLATPVGNTLYVGGSGPGNYTTIQDAVNDSSDGDTVYIYNDSSPYHEAVRITHSIRIVGEDKPTTIIDGERIFWDIISVDAEHVAVSNLTIQGGNGSGISIHSNHTLISQSIIRDCRTFDVQIEAYDDAPITDTVLEDNVIQQSWSGVFCFRTMETILEGNFIDDNTFGINQYQSFSNTILSNVMSRNTYGIQDEFGGRNRFEQNTFENNTLGIQIMACGRTQVIHNIFIHNDRDAYCINEGVYELQAKLSAWNHNDTFVFTQYRLLERIIWRENYWEKPRLFPYCISGELWLWTYWEPHPIPWVAFDWHPAQKTFQYGT
ncbi:MAG TPA: NosD domain-containing protein [Candidatus Thermoplasmatota archaeon]|nr:NosD domain-containing protein [Candidatus Thermoplasmatota archaeon]